MRVFYNRNLFPTLFTCLITSMSSFAQNLVPNPSFEQVNCPTGYTGFPAQVETFMHNWYSATCASPDPMTNCSSNANTSVPDVWFGNQTARTGTNYMGLGFYGSWYEYIGVKLTQPLISGEVYQVSFYVSMAEQVRYAADALGIYFSTSEIRCYSGFSGPVLTHVPQVVQAAGLFLTDSVGWTAISGTYTALGGEEYIVIGYFKPWNVSALQDIGNGGLTRCYYYIDDVTVEKIEPLSIPITSFDVSVNSDKTVDIRWEVSDHDKNCSYTLEKSTDGYTFESIYTTSSSAFTMNFTDRFVSGQTAYYRLKGLHCDGTYSYSEIRTVDLPFLSVELYPNPARDELTIRTPQAQKNPVECSIYDASGRNLQTEIITFDVRTISIAHLKKGIYTVVIRNGNETITRKLSKI